MRTIVESAAWENQKAFIASPVQSDNSGFMFGIKSGGNRSFLHVRSSGAELEEPPRPRYRHFRYCPM